MENMIIYNFTDVFIKYWNEEKKEETHRSLCNLMKYIKENKNSDITKLLKGETIHIGNKITLTGFIRYNTKNKTFTIKFNRSIFNISEADEKNKAIKSFNISEVLTNKT